jgi:hypothetical protein
MWLIEKNRLHNNVGTTCAWSPYFFMCTYRLVDWYHGVDRFIDWYHGTNL